MARAPRRPNAVRLGDLGARVVRGPKDGKWYWRLWRTRNGVEDTVQTGWFTELEVDKVLAGLVAHGVDTPRARNRVETVTDLLEFWLGDQQQRPDLSPRTVEVRTAACRHLKPGIGAVVVDALDRSVLEGYRNHRLREPVRLPRKKRVDGQPTGEWEPTDTGRLTAPRTVHFEIHVLRMAWKWGREVGIVPARDLPSISVQIKGHVRNRFTPTQQQVALVLRELEGWARLGLLLYAGTGARLDEVAALTWRQVDLAGEVVDVHGKRGTRTVPLAAPLVAALRDAGPGAPDERVLTCAHGTARAIYDRLKVACKHASVPYFAPGGVRRLVVRALYRSGEDPSVAGAVVGHSPVVALRHYREVTGDEMREAMTKARLGFLPDPDAKVIELPQGAKS